MLTNCLSIRCQCRSTTVVELADRTSTFNDEESRDILPQDLDEDGGEGARWGRARGLTRSRSTALHKMFSSVGNEHSAPNSPTPSTHLRERSNNLSDAISRVAMMRATAATAAGLPGQRASSDGAWGLSGVPGWRPSINGGVSHGQLMLIGDGTNLTSGDIAPGGTQSAGAQGGMQAASSRGNHQGSESSSQGSPLLPSRSAGSGGGEGGGGAASGSSSSRGRGGGGAAAVGRNRGGRISSSQGSNIPFSAPATSTPSDPASSHSYQLVSSTNSTSQQPLGGAVSPGGGGVGSAAGGSTGPLLYWPPPSAASSGAPSSASSRMGRTSSGSSIWGYGGGGGGGGGGGASGSRHWSALLQVGLHNIQIACFSMLHYTCPMCLRGTDSEEIF